VLKNGMKLCVVQPPSFGYKQNELMSDIAVGVGAKYFSEKVGDDLSLISLSDLGFAKKVVVSKEDTIIIGADGDEAEIEVRVSELMAAKELATKKADMDFISTRIASITGGIGVIYVGGNTDLEQKELFDRVDDAVCAVRSAIEEGIVPGGGIALRDMANIIDAVVSHSTEEDRIAKDILFDSMYAPFDQILKNAGIDPSNYDGILEMGVGLDIKTMATGSMIELGIIDPVKVTKNALTNAVSVASTILSTNSIITIAREK
jgi:chaperonin GroEL